MLSGSDDTRLTKILARRSLRCRSQFFKDWENTANKYNIRLNLTESNLPEWNGKRIYYDGNKFKFTTYLQKPNLRAELYILEPQCSTNFDNI